MTSVHRMADRQQTADQRSDAELITAVRAGSRDGYDVLYRRHVDAARNMARQLTRSQAELEDLVAEAFARLLDTLRSGGGPDTAFRAYLLTTVRHCMYDKTRRDRRLEYSADLSRVDPGEPFVDTALEGLEATLVARAFGSLPERWQTVLWHTEVEGETPAQVAPLLGLTPNGVSALAYRAREGLRQAYLQVHLQDTAGERCRYAVERLGAWARYGLAKRERAHVDAHLDGCARCRTLAAELADVNRGLRVIVAPLLIGAPWAAGYLSAAKTAGAGATATATGGTATATGGTATGTAGATAGATALASAAGSAAAAASGTAAASGVAAASTISTGLAAAVGSVTASGPAQAVGLLVRILHTPIGQTAVGAASVAAAIAVGVTVIPGGGGPGQHPRGSAAPPAAVAGSTPGPTGPTGPTSTSVTNGRPGKHSTAAQRRAGAPAASQHGVAPPQPTASGGPDAPTATGQPAEESAGTSS